MWIIGELENWHSLTLILSPISNGILMYSLEYHIWRYILNPNCLLRRSAACCVAHVVYVNFILEWRILQFNIHSARQLLENVHLAIYVLLSEFLSEDCWDKVNKWNMFLILRKIEMSARGWTTALRLISRHITYKIMATS